MSSRQCVWVQLNDLGHGGVNTSITWVHQSHQAGTCASPPNSKPADLLAGLLAELAQVPALQAGLPARQAGSSPASRSTCLPSGYQLSKQVYLLAKLLYLLAGLVPAQQAGLPACRAGTSSASRSAYSPSWYLYQPGKQVSLLAESESRSACSRSRQAG
ncbi:hypothetical protein PCASD_18410 [Puccinia coronata f. sp. avenae]|uniref:Uncharacterized protein n=1 Tax=Puccinia coronata f. sp. avenae TaxID=200324 RepID=A0A2N5TVB2_9BASI|nr:hypothetical protein PCASD_18410 [Puccinia coronata f. sp. avenae]